MSCSIFQRSRFVRHLCCKRKVDVFMGNSNSNASRPGSAANSADVKSPTQAKANHSTMAANAPKPGLHFKCRTETYPRNNSIKRFPVPDDLVSWSTSYPEYSATDYTAQSVASKPVWADVDYKNETGAPAKWNALDGKVDRRSHMGLYDIVDGLPRNPIGRTGVCSRGNLGRWGPNHAADPIVTRWKRESSGEIQKHTKTGKPILQFISIQRGDSGEWAIPGGMVSPGEAVSLTLKREFSEETMNSLDVSQEEQERISKQVSALFNEGIEVYRGYVDDPRNTDNCWMETVAVNFHDEAGDSVGKFKLHAGDDAVGVRWADIGSEIALYASHLHFVSQVVKIHSAHW